MKNQIVGVLIIGILVVGIGVAMPMSSCTPEQVAEILVQPIRDDIAAQKAALIAGEITVEQYMAYLALTEVKLEMKVMLLDMLIGSDIPANDYRERLCSILPWNIR